MLFVMSSELDSRDDENRGKSTIIKFGAIREIRDRVRTYMDDHKMLSFSLQ